MLYGLTRVFSSLGNNDIEQLNNENIKIGLDHDFNQFRVFNQLIEDSIIFIPNTFTPDGDYHNDIFNPSIHEYLSLIEYRLQIYNRWGEVVFQSMDPHEGWDGLYHNKPVSSDTYTWKLEIHFMNESENIAKQIFTGRLNLLR